MIVKITFSILFIFILGRCDSQDISKIVYENDVNVQLILPKDTILLGQLFYVNLEMMNNSNDTIYVGEGGDYRGGRKDSFDVQVKDKNGTILKRKESNFLGGLFGFEEILPSKSRMNEIYIPKWVSIEEIGTYKIEVSKNFEFSNENPFYRLDDSMENVKRVFKKSYASIEVIEDDGRSEKYLTELMLNYNSVKEIVQKEIVDGYTKEMNKYSRINVLKTRYRKMIENLEYIRKNKL